MKRVPSFWWDFDKNMDIIVESDDDNYPIVGKFYVKGKYADEEIDKAFKYISDLNAGRKNYRIYTEE